MAKDIVIVGAGGLGREVEWHIRRINAQSDVLKWNILGYYDDALAPNEVVGKYKVLGDTNTLLKYAKSIDVVVAIGSPRSRYKVVNKLRENANLSFPNIIAPSAVISDDIKMGCGNIITEGCMITVNVELSDFAYLNHCTVGHDVKFENFVSLHTGAHISGNVHLSLGAEIGAGTTIIQGLHVGAWSVSGTMAAIIKDVPDNVLVVGVPAIVKKELCGTGEV